VRFVEPAALRLHVGEQQQRRRAAAPSSVTFAENSLHADPVSMTRVLWLLFGCPLAIAISSIASFLLISHLRLGGRITGALASGRSSSELLASVDALYFFVILSVLGSWHLLKVARHARSRDLTLSAYLSLPANQKLAADFEMEAGIHYATPELAIRRCSGGLCQRRMVTRPHERPVRVDLHLWMSFGLCNRAGAS
jgi:hypothetical protein